MLSVFLDFFVGEGEIDNLLLVVEVGDAYGKSTAKLAVNLDDDGDNVGGEIFVVPGGPFVVGAEVLEHFASEMWGERLE